MKQPYFSLLWWDMNRNLPPHWGSHFAIFALFELCFDISCLDIIREALWIFSIWLDSLLGHLFALVHCFVQIIQKLDQSTKHNAKSSKTLTPKAEKVKMSDVQELCTPKVPKTLEERVFFFLCSNGCSFSFYWVTKNDILNCLDDYSVRSVCHKYSNSLFSNIFNILVNFSIF